MDKKQLRKILLFKKNELTKDYITNSSKKIFTTIEQLELFKSSNNIFIYVDFNNEVVTKNFILKHINTKNIFVPKIVNNEMKLIKISSLENLQLNNFNILEPKENNFSSEKMDLVITPAIAFDKFGYRIGYGKGYYDKYFATENFKTKIGVCFEKMLQEKLPTENHDKKVDILITENNIYYTGEKND